MKIRVPAIALVAALFAMLPGGSALAQSYPARPVTFIVPFAAGGATDVLARQFAERMARTFGQKIIIENVAGAGGTLGAAGPCGIARRFWPAPVGLRSRSSTSPAPYGPRRGSCCWLFRVPRSP